MHVLWCLAFPLLSYGWWDEGHAVIGNIAMLDLTEKDPTAVQKINELLNLWEEKYPELSTLPIIPIWADHIKCYNKGLACAKLERYDGMKIFDSLHWTSYITHIAPNVDIKGTIYEFNPLPEIGAQWALEKMITQASFGCIETVGDNAGPQDGCMANIEEQGTKFSTNFHLRFIAHLFTDVHNPCHTSEVYTKAHVDDDGKPIGDMGCNRWELDQTDICPQVRDLEGRPDNLHALWDAVMGTMPRRYGGDGGFTDENVKEKAESIINKYSRSDVEDRITKPLDGFNIESMVKDSNALACREVFRDFDLNCYNDLSTTTSTSTTSTSTTSTSTTSTSNGNFCSSNGDFCPAVDKKYCPSTDYIKKMTDVAEEQIAVAGYRFSNVLFELAKHLPSADQVF